VSNTGYCSGDFGLHRGFQHYEDYPVSLGELAQSSGYDQLLMDLTGHQYYLSRKRASQLSSNFLKWQSRAEGKPFFAFLNYFDAHAPYVPPKNLALQYAGKVHPESRPFKLEQPFDSGDIQELNDAYDACVAYLDQELERLFDELSARRILDDTLVVVTSDHGEEFYEHHLLEHGNGLYLTQTHVPLILRFPSAVPAGMRLEAPVELRNLALTVVDVVGIQQATPFPGEPLVSHWQPHGDPGVKPVLAEVDVPSWFPNSGPMKSVLVQPYHFIVNSDGREELYHITRDSSELDDLAGTEEGREALPALRAAIGSLLV
jgi:arylsulfatase A-like enzyme